MLLMFPSMSFGVPGMPRIEPKTVWTNLAIMILGEAFLSDALVALLSRTDFISGAKVDLPLAWKERDRHAYLAMYGILALLAANSVGSCVPSMCYTHTPETGPRSMAGYTLGLCPVLEVDGEVDGIEAICEEYGVYPSVSSVVASRPARTRARTGTCLRQAVRINRGASSHELAVIAESNGPRACSSTAQHWQRKAQPHPRN